MKENEDYPRSTNQFVKGKVNRDDPHDNNIRILGY